MSSIERNALSVQKRLAVVLAATAMAVAGLLSGPSLAAADPGPAAKPWAGNGVSVLVNRNAATAQAQIFCGVQVNNFDPVDLGGGAEVNCHDANNFPVAVPQITIRVTLAMDDGTSRGPSSTSSAINTSFHFEAAFLPFCVPDRIGVVAEVTVVFPANTASGTFFSPNLVQNTC
jgi:hypothetical protein